MVDSPLRQIPAEYDDFSPNTYNPQFTRDINTKMRVPNRLSGIFTHKSEDEDLHPPVPDKGHMEMSVPDRILIAGQNQHIGLRENTRNFSDLDLPSVTPNDQYVGLTTPPRVLTLDERPFPDVIDTDEQHTSKANQDHHGELVLPEQDTLGHGDAELSIYSSPDALFLSTGDDTNDVLMKRHLLKMTRKISLLEEDNKRRYQRELVLYPLVIGYILMKMFSWLRG